MTAIDPGVSPCRTHPCSIEHAHVVNTYRERLWLWQEQAEAATGGYEADLVLYKESNPPPLFSDHLQELARERAALCFDSVDEF